MYYELRFKVRSLWLTLYFSVRLLRRRRESWKYCQSSYIRLASEEKASKFSRNQQAKDNDAQVSITEVRNGHRQNQRTILSTKCTI